MSDKDLKFEEALRKEHIKRFKQKGCGYGARYNGATVRDEIIIKIPNT